MVAKHIAILAVATLSALGAGGGVLALAHGRSPLPATSTIARGADGHFWADGAILTGNASGVAIHFLVDTGASSVALTQADARAAGVDVSDLRYTRPVYTAQGRAQAASIILNAVDIGGVRVEGVKALVLESGSNTSLLGMSYLGRLSRIEATPAALTLRR